MKFSFGSRELEKCLQCLGFNPQPQVGSRHRKYSLSGKTIPAGMRPFFIVLQGKREFDPQTSAKIIKQIKRFGFTDEKIIKCFEKSN